VRDSRGAIRRRKKQRERKTENEVKAFEYGMRTHREAVTPTVKRRAAAVGFGLGVAATVGAYYLLGWALHG